MCHYTQLTFPVPAVIVVTLNPPAGAGVEPVKPAPIVIVLLSGYLSITIPELPGPATLLEEEPPPPPPLFTVASPGVVAYAPLAPPPVPPVPPVGVPNEGLFLPPPPPPPA
jgi:hypothetical protein